MFSLTPFVIGEHLPTYLGPHGVSLTLWIQLSGVCRGPRPWPGLGPAGPCCPSESPVLTGSVVLSGPPRPTFANPGVILHLTANCQLPVSTGAGLHFARSCRAGGIRAVPSEGEWSADILYLLLPPASQTCQKSPQCSLTSMHLEIRQIIFILVLGSRCNTHNGQKTIW